MSSEKLMDQFGGHWGKHPIHSPEDWRYEVGNGDTRLGYWDWVEARIDNDNDDQKTYVIHSESESETQNEPMYWSNKEGWTTLDLATRFKPEELHLGLPTTGSWISLDQAEEKESGPKAEESGQQSA